MAVAYEVNIALTSTTILIVVLIAKWMTVGCFHFLN